MAAVNGTGVKNAVIIVVICLLALSPIIWHFAREVAPDRRQSASASEPCKAAEFAPHNDSLCDLLDAVNDQKKTARGLAANQYDLFTAISVSALILTTAATFLLGLTGNVWLIAGKLCTALAAIGTGVIGIWNLPNWVNVNGKLQLELAALESTLEISVQLAKESKSQTIKLDGQNLTVDAFIFAGHQRLAALLAAANTDPWVKQSAK